MIKGLIKHDKVALIVGLVLTLLFSFGLKNLKSDFNTKSWFLKTDPALQNLIELEKNFGGDDFYLFLIKGESNLINNRSLKILEDFEKDLFKIKGMREFLSLKSTSLIKSTLDDITVEPILMDQTPEYYKVLKEEIRHNKSIDGFLVNKNQNAFLSIIKLREFNEEVPDYKEITFQLKSLIQKYQGGNKNLSFHLSGQLAIQDAFARISGKDLKSIAPVASLLIIIFLYLSFNSILLALSPIFLCTIVITSTLGLAGYLDFKFNSLLSLLPGIILAICCADLVHIFKSQQKLANIEKALTFNIRPTLLTSVTTAIGFLSFTFSEIAPIRTLGILTSFGVLWAWALCFLIVPFVLKRVIVTEPRFIKFNTQKLYSFVKKNRKKIIGSFLILTVISLYLTTKVSINSNPFKFFKESLPIYQANKTIKDSFGGNLGPVITLRNKDIRDPKFLQKVEKFEKWLHTQPNIVKVRSILDDIRTLNDLFTNTKESKIPNDKSSISQLLLTYEFSEESLKDLRRKVTSDFKTMKMDIYWTVNNSDEAKESNDKIQNYLQKNSFDGETNGKNPLFSKLNDYIVDTVLISIITTSLIVALMLMFLFKDFKLGLISMIPNIFPILIGASFTVLLGINIDVGVALVASVCMGIAVDDTIHFIYHYKANLKENTSTAMSKTFDSSVPSLIWTTIILCIGFGSFTIGNFIPNINFGLLCFIILTVALITDIILLPAILEKD
jgi:predicted RND superfamily exporter protein